MKLVIVWSNGDKEKFDVSDEYAESFKKNPPFMKSHFREWNIHLGLMGLNMEHARKVYLE